MRLLGIDYGTKRTGIALSDEGGRVAFPHCTLSTNNQLVTEIQNIVEEYKVEKIVMGESKNFAMQDNLLMFQIRECKADLEDAISVPIEMHTEFMTSSQVASEHFGAIKNDTRAGDKERQVKNIDARAASVMLQGYIDSNK
jgi:putative Holliday junction resolvase